MLRIGIGIIFLKLTCWEQEQEPIHDLNISEEIHDKLFINYLQGFCKKRNTR